MTALTSMGIAAGIDDGSESAGSAWDRGVRKRGRVKLEEKSSGVRERHRPDGGSVGIVGPRKRCFSSWWWSWNCGRDGMQGMVEGRLRAVSAREAPFSLAERPLVRTKAVERRWYGLRSKYWSMIG